MTTAHISQTETAAPPPPSFDGRKIWNDFLGEIEDQGECGACYSFAATTVLQVRYRLFSNNALRPSFNPLAGLVCHPIDLTREEHRLLQFDLPTQSVSHQRTQFTACSGGTLSEMVRYYYRLGALERECVAQTPIQTYIDATNKLPSCDLLTPPNQCLNPEVAKRYWPVQDFYIVSDSKDAKVIAEAMKYDLCSHGPMLVGFWIFDDFLDNFDAKKVYVPKPGQPKQGGHAVTLISWGTTTQNGKKIDFWLCANSWGKKWSNNEGYFMLEIANPDLELEFNHLGIIPQIPGVEREFALLQRRSEIEDLDRDLRLMARVNPFTLLTPQSTQFMLDNGFPITLVFDHLQYTKSNTLGRCCESDLQTRIGRQWEFWVGMVGIVFFICAVTFLGVVLRHKSR
jgi:hypothetical protein